MIQRLRLLMVVALFMAGADASQAQVVAPANRGQLLYENHCRACHDQQVHWRQNKLAHDWNSLRAQVQRWQVVAKLGWRNEEVDQVARHLNDTIYRFPNTGMAQRN